MALACFVKRRGEKEVRSSFFEKKEAKKLCQFGIDVHWQLRQSDKSFLLLFFKKEALLLFIGADSSDSALISGLAAKIS